MKKPEKSPPKETAVAIDGAVGKVAALAPSVTTRIRKGVGRIPAKNKTRLPRREKKALATAALKSSGRTSQPIRSL